MCQLQGAAPWPTGIFATIPDASRIAFDPAHRRVWRICARCGEWNLLGAEAAERALPELEARFAAAPKRAGGEGFAPAHVGSALELLKIGATVVAVNDAVLRKRRRQLALSKWIGGPAILAYLLAFLYMEIWERAPSRNWSPILVGYSMVFLIFAIVRRRHHLPVNRQGVVLAVAVGLGAAAVDSWRHPWHLYGLIAMTIVAAILAFTMRPPSYLVARLDNGEELHVYSWSDLKQLSMSWTMAGELTLHGFANGAEISGPAAIAPLRKMIKHRNVVFIRSAVSDAAYDLVRTAGGLRGVLHALEGFRDDNSGRVVIAELPKVYVVALDLALADLAADHDDARGDDIAEMQVRAAEIAATAEALDATMNEPAT